MNRPTGVRRLLRGSVDRRSLAGDVDREIRSHIEMMTDELIERGMTRADARAAAEGAFGDQDAIAAECRAVRRRRVRERRRIEVLQGIWQDLRFAARTLRRSPGFTAVAVLTIALGIGANSAIFSAIDAILVRALPFHEPDRLVAVSVIPGQSTSKRTLVEIRERQRAFEHIGLWSRWGFTLTGSGEPEVLNGVVSTADLFTVLGARALIGRTYGPGEDQPGRNMVVVLSHGLWTRRFGADSGIIGTTIELDIGAGSSTRTVIGVMPPDFVFNAPGRDAWVPTVINPADTNDYTAGYMLPIARLRAGVTLAGARADVARVMASLRQSDPALYGPRFGREATVVDLRESLVGKVGPALEVLLGSGAFVLLIACVNVANLLLARSTARAREMTVRSSLGAGRGRLVRLLVTESLLLALLGGVAGILLAFWSGRLLDALLPADLPRVGNVGAGPRVLVLGLATSCVVGLLFGLAPVLHLSRSLTAGLREGGRGASTGVRGRRTMGALIASEVALAFVLAVAAGLMLQSFWHLRHEDPGFDPDGVLTLSLSPPVARYDEDRLRVYYEQVLERVAAVPGVGRVGAVHILPFGGSNWNPTLVIEGRTLAAGDERPEVDWRVATARYFEAMHIPLVRGRLFDAVDRGNTRVALVNQALVRRDFPNEDPVGKRVRTFFEGRDNWVTIVGVVGDMKDQALAAPARPQMYRPHTQFPLAGMTLMVRTTGEPSRLAEAVRQAVWSVDRNVPIDRLGPLDGVVATSLAQPRLLVLLLGLFGALALVLGAVGIYGVISYGVAQRTQEIGVRMALGASHRDVVRLVVSNGLALSGVGLALGIGLAFAVTRLLASQLHDVGPTDPLTFAVTVVVLAAVALVASWIPARRAAAVDPTESIRTLT